MRTRLQANSALDVPTSPTHERNLLNSWAADKSECIVDFIVRHIGSASFLKYVARWNGYTPEEHTIETPEHLPQNSITRYMWRAQCQYGKKPKNRLTQQKRPALMSFKPVRANISQLRVYALPDQVYKTTMLGDHKVSSE